MVVSAKVLFFTKPIAGTPPVTDVSVSLGFVPKGVIAFHANTSSSSYAEGYGTGFGFSDGTTSRCVATSADDNAATSNAGNTVRSALVAICSSTSGTVLDEADVTFQSDTITLSWVTRSANPATIMALVFGGSDITDVTVGNFNGNNVTGNHTTTGTSYTPDVELYIPTNASTSDESGNQAMHQMGAARTSSEEWACYWQTTDGNATNSLSTRYQTNANCIARGSNSSGARNCLADFVAFTSTGRTINYSDADTVTTNLQHFMAIEGGSHSIGSFNVTAGTGNFTPVTGLSFTPKAILLVSTGGSANVTAAEANARYAVGVIEPSGFSICVSAHDTNLAATSICTKVHQTAGTRCLRLHTANATAASSVTEVDLSWVSMNSDGFTLNRVTNTTTLGNELVHYWAIGDSAAAANNVERALATETVALSDTRTRLAAKIRTRTDTAIAVSESRARLAAKMRPLSTQTTTLSESVIRVKGKVKSLATETITVTGGTLARLLAKVRIGSDTTAIVENRARLAAKNRALATQTITVGAGTIAEIKGAVKTISQTVTIGENLARLSSKIRALATQTATVGAGTAARLAAKIRAIPQTTAISENLVRIKGRLKSLATETITVTVGSIARLSAKIRTRSETATIGETSVRRKASMRVLALQTITVGENIVRLLSKIRTISQTIILSESTSRLTAKIRALATQTIIIAEDLQRTLTAGAQNIVKTITQTIIVGESIARLKGSWRTIPQSFTVGSGTLSRLCVRVRTIIPQTIIIAENATRVSAKNRLLALQTVSLTDNRARIKGAIKTISQTIIIGENIVRRLTKIRALSIQTAVLADSVTRQIIGGPVEIIRSLTQTVALSDSLGRRLTVQRILTQTVPKAESLVRVRGVVRTLSQSILLSESRSRIKSALRPISQTTLSSDSINRLNTIRRTVIQTTVIAENVAQETIGNLARALVETITVSDSIVRRTAKLVILDQFVLIAEQASRISAKLRTIPAQTITLTDSTTQEINVIIKHILKTIAQATTITDYAKIEVVKKSQRFRKILDPSIKRLISNHPAWLLGTRGQHDHYEEFSP